jgi:hypothetical protein
MNPPRFAILFWYYKDTDVCQDRAKLLRRLNPDTFILGLFGGEPETFTVFQNALADTLDDNWAYPGGKSPEWKWRYGDRMICEWFVQRGSAFEWDTLAIMQWDMLALAPVAQLFGSLRPDELYLPGLRPLNEIESRWWWTRPGTEVHDDYLAFKDWIAHDLDYRGEFQACQFVTAALPRTFLQRYARIKQPELGFLEYRLPVYAAAFGFPVSDLPHLPTQWVGEPAQTRRVTLSAAKTDIPTTTLVTELLSPAGARLFHPVTRRFPSNRSGLLIWLLSQSAAIVVRKILRPFLRLIKNHPVP